MSLLNDKLLNHMSFLEGLEIGREQGAKFQQVADTEYLRYLFEEAKTPEEFCNKIYEEFVKE